MQLGSPSPRPSTQCLLIPVLLFRDLQTSPSCLWRSHPQPVPAEKGSLLLRGAFQGSPAGCPRCHDCLKEQFCQDRGIPETLLFRGFWHKHGGPWSSHSWGLLSCRLHIQELESGPRTLLALDSHQHSVLALGWTLDPHVPSKPCPDTACLGLLPSNLSSQCEVRCLCSARASLPLPSRLCF